MDDYIEILAEWNNTQTLLLYVAVILLFGILCINLARLLIVEVRSIKGRLNK